MGHERPLARRDAARRAPRLNLTPRYGSSLASVIRPTAAALVIVTVGTVVVASTAWAKSERDLAKSACVAGAELWDGSAIVGDASSRVVSTKPFTGLTAAKDKELRKVVRAVMKDPESEGAVHAFGAWCKKHFATVAKITESSFEVPLLSRKSG